MSPSLGEATSLEQGVEFVIADDFYQPLVYAPDGNPETFHDVCSAGGIVLRRLSPQWFVCQRDWN